MSQQDSLANLLAEAENVLADAEANADVLQANETNENDAVLNQLSSRTPLRSPRHRLSRSLSPRTATSSQRDRRPLSASYQNIRLEYQIIAGQRKNSKLLYTTDEKFLYVKHNKTRYHIQYDCYDKGCNAQVIVTNEDGVCYKKNTNYEHNHGDAAEIVKSMQLTNTVKNSVSDSVTLAANIGASGSGNVRAIYQNCLEKLVFLK